jgi:hypothetical protein
MRRAACRFIRAAIRIERQLVDGLGHRWSTAGVVEIVTTCGLGGARHQQQTGEDHRNGGSPVSQRPRWNKSDHLRTKPTKAVAAQNEP